MPSSNDNAIPEQGNLVLQRLRQLHEDIVAVNEGMSTRGNTVMASSAGLMAFVVAGEFWGNGGPLIRTVLSVVSLIAGTAVIALALNTFRPRDSALGGHLEWDEWVNQYLDVPVAAALDQLVSDNLQAINRRTGANSRISATIRWMLRCFLAQSIAVGMAVGVKICEQICA